MKNFRKKCVVAVINLTLLGIASSYFSADVSAFKPATLLGVANKTTTTVVSKSSTEKDEKKKDNKKKSEKETDEDDEENGEDTKDDDENGDGEKQKEGSKTRKLSSGKTVITNNINTPGSRVAANKQGAVSEENARKESRYAGDFYDTYGESKGSSEADRPAAFALIQDNIDFLKTAYGQFNSLRKLCDLVSKGTKKTVEDFKNAFDISSFQELFSKQDFVKDKVLNVYNENIDKFKQKLQYATKATENNGGIVDAALTDSLYDAAAAVLGVMKKAFIDRYKISDGLFKALVKSRFNYDMWIQTKEYAASVMVLRRIIYDELNKASVTADTVRSLLNEVASIATSNNPSDQQTKCNSYYNFLLNKVYNNNKQQLDNNILSKFVDGSGKLDVAKFVETFDFVIREKDYEFGSVVNVPAQQMLYSDMQQTVNNTQTNQAEEAKQKKDAERVKTLALISSLILNKGNGLDSKAIRGYCETILSTDKSFALRIEQTLKDDINKYKSGSVSNNYNVIAAVDRLLMVLSYFSNDEAAFKQTYGDSGYIDFTSHKQLKNIVTADINTLLAVSVDYFVESKKQLGSYLSSENKEFTSTNTFKQYEARLLNSLYSSDVLAKIRQLEAYYDVTSGDYGTGKMASLLIGKFMVAGINSLEVNSPVSTSSDKGLSKDSYKLESAAGVDVSEFVGKYIGDLKSFRTKVEDLLKPYTPYTNNHTIVLKQLAPILIRMSAHLARFFPAMQLLMCPVKDLTPSMLDFLDFSSNLKLKNLLQGFITNKNLVAGAEKHGLAYYLSGIYAIFLSFVRFLAYNLIENGGNSTLTQLYVSVAKALFSSATVSDYIKEGQAYNIFGKLPYADMTHAFNTNFGGPSVQNFIANIFASPYIFERLTDNSLVMLSKFLTTSNIFLNGIPGDMVAPGGGLPGNGNRGHIGSLNGSAGVNELNNAITKAGTGGMSVVELSTFMDWIMNQTNLDSILAGTGDNGTVATLNVGRFAKTKFGVNEKDSDIKYIADLKSLIASHVGKIDLPSFGERLVKEQNYSYKLRDNNGNDNIAGAVYSVGSILAPSLSTFKMPDSSSIQSSINSGSSSSTTPTTNDQKLEEIFKLDPSAVRNFFNKHNGLNQNTINNTTFAPAPMKTIYNNTYPMTNPFMYNARPAYMYPSYGGMRTF